MKLISTCPSLAEFGKPCYGQNKTKFYELMPQYHYAKQLRQAFDIGCSMRYSTANTTKGGRPFLPDMPWTYGLRNSLNVAVGRNADGSWAVGIANPTGIPVVPFL